MLTPLKLKLNISRTNPQRVLSIIVVLLTGLNFLAGGALAGDCQGGADCLICAGSVHPQSPEKDRGATSDGCQPLAQNSSCGFEVSPGPVKPFSAVPSVLPDNKQADGNFSDISVVGSVRHDIEQLAQTVISNLHL